MPDESSLFKKLKSYSLFSAGILASSAIADAQVVYTDINPDHHGGYSDFPIDLNNDGITDFTIVHEGSADYPYGSSYSVAIYPQSGNSAVPYNPLNQGDTINSQLSWYNWSSLTLASYSKFLTYSGGIEVSTRGAWLGVSQKLLAVRFNISGEQHYGWIRLSVSSRATAYVAYDYAYEQTADVPIVAGDIGCPRFYIDNDHDYYGSSSDTGEVFCYNPGIEYSLNNNDCDDFNSAVNPSISEACNNADDNCNGAIDEGFILTTYFADADGDTYGNPSNFINSCSTIPGYVNDSTDCNDADSLVNPGATEICNGLDDNCNNQVDDGLVFTIYYADNDSDSYGDNYNTILSCEAIIGYVTNSDDCNDSAALINPGAAEICNSLDDNCDGSIDEGLLNIYYADSDNDGFGDITNFIMSCTPPIGFIVDATDCNDSIASINPEATEVCNGIDDNCNGSTDEGVLNTYFLDADHDGFGDPYISVLSCTIPYNYVVSNTDCNDADSLINPAAPEVCNNIDDNCNNQIDDGLPFTTYYADSDGDSYGDTYNAIIYCEPVPGYVNDNTDCNDSNALINPSAIETCNSIDDNCNILIDDGLTFTTYYADNDEDSYGNPDNFVSACDSVSGYVLDSTDCDDTNPEINPIALEISNNGIDDDCDGYVDEFGVGTSSVENDQFQFSIFPNPAQDAATIQFTIGNATHVRIVVCDVEGREILLLLNDLLPAGNHSLQLNTSEFAKGVYMVKVVYDESMKSGKLIVQ